MKNSEMKVSGLLEQKAEIESEINVLDKAMDSLSGKSIPSHNFDKVGAVGLYARSAEYRIKVAKEIMLKAVNEMLEIKTKELEPINKKLEAIELMLNS